MGILTLHCRKNKSLVIATAILIVAGLGCHSSSNSRGETPLMDRDRLFREAVRSIGLTSPIDGQLQDPGALIRAANLLHRLGKEEALRACECYVDQTGEYESGKHEGVFLLLRILFEVPDPPGHHPKILLGLAIPEYKGDPNEFPRFPVHIVEDIPFVVIWGYAIGGQPENARNHIAHFRNSGKLRTKPLIPTNHPLNALESVLETTKPFLTGIMGGKDKFAWILLANQLLRLVGPENLGTDSGGDTALLSRDDAPDERWEIFRARIAKLQFSWNVNEQRYIVAE